MKSKIHIKKFFLPLIFFSVFPCCSQSLQPSLKNLAYFDNKPAKLESISKTQKPILNISINSKTQREKNEERILSSFPTSIGAHNLLNLYYNLSDSYLEIKRIRDSFTSHELINNGNLNARIYLINPGDLRNLNDYGVLLNLKIKPEFF
jgi:hypothetical protein